MKEPISVAVCMPKHNTTRASKLKWLEEAVFQTPCDIFLTPQEYFGGHYVMKNDLHMEREWLKKEVGDIARRAKKHIGVGACSFDQGQGATEDYLYFDDDGKYLGHHSKYALPSYDDMRTGGHGQLWPETNYKRRATPIEIPKLRLRVGTIFCWEVFSQTLWGSYSFAKVNLIVHPIKFAPRGWLKNKKLEDGKKHIVGFGYEPKSNIWRDRLITASRHQCMCPIAVSCNSWDLGMKFMACIGHIDEMKKGGTNLMDIPSLGHCQKIHIFHMVPEFYEGLDHHHSAGAFKAHTGSLEGYMEMGEWTMHGKIRRLEAQLLGGSTAMDCSLKASTINRRKQSVTQRAFGKPQKVKRGNKPSSDLFS